MAARLATVADAPAVKALWDGQLAVTRSNFPNDTFEPMPLPTVEKMIARGRVYVYLNPGIQGYIYCEKRGDKEYGVHACILQSGNTSTRGNRFRATLRECCTLWFTDCQTINVVECSWTWASSGSNSFTRQALNRLGGQGTVTADDPQPGYVTWRCTPAQGLAAVGTV